MLEKLLNPEVEKNVVKQVATPASMSAYGHEVRRHGSFINHSHWMQILTGPVSKTREITSNANEKIRLGREPSFCNHLAILGSCPIIIKQKALRCSLYK